MSRAVDRRIIRWLAMVLALFVVFAACSSDPGLSTFADAKQVADRAGCGVSYTSRSNRPPTRMTSWGNCLLKADQVDVVTLNSVSTPQGLFAAIAAFCKGNKVGMKIFFMYGMNWVTYARSLADAQAWSKKMGGRVETVLDCQLRMPVGLLFSLYSAVPQ